MPEHFSRSPLATPCAKLCPREARDAVCVHHPWNEWSQHGVQLTSCSSRSLGDIRGKYEHREVLTRQPFHNFQHCTSFKLIGCQKCPHGCPHMCHLGRVPVQGVLFLDMQTPSLHTLQRCAFNKCACIIIIIIIINLYDFSSKLHGLLSICTISHHRYKQICLSYIHALEGKLEW